MTTMMCLAISLTIGIPVSHYNKARVYDHGVFLCLVPSGSVGHYLRRIMIAIVGVCGLLDVVLYWRVYKALRCQRRIQTDMTKKLIHKDNQVLASSNKQNHNDLKLPTTNSSPPREMISKERNRSSPRTSPRVICNGPQNKPFRLQDIEVTNNHNSASPQISIPEHRPQKFMTQDIQIQGGNSETEYLKGGGNYHHLNSGDDGVPTVSGTLQSRIPRRSSLSSFVLMTRHQNFLDVASTRLSPAERQATNMMLVINIIFLVVWLPAIVAYMIPTTTLVRIASSNNDLYLFIFFLKHIAYISNFVNPLAYGFMNKQFRKECLKELRCK